MLEAVRGSTADGTRNFAKGDGNDGEGEKEVPAQLKPYAAKVLMKVLYAARYARFELLRAICALAQRVTKWDRECDMKLYRLMSYIQSSLHVRMTGWIGDDPSELSLHLFADADFAGCNKTSRSTSGTHLSVLGGLIATGRSKGKARNRAVCHTVRPSWKS